LQPLQAALHHSSTLEGALLTVHASALWRRCGVFVSDSRLDRMGLFTDVLGGNGCPPFTILALLGHARNRLASGYKYDNNGHIILWARDEDWEAGWANTCYEGDTDQHGNPSTTNAVFRSIPFSMTNRRADSFIVLISTCSIPMAHEILAEYPADFDDHTVSHAAAGLLPLPP